MHITALDVSLILLLFTVLATVSEKVKQLRDWFVSLFFVTKYCNRELATLLLSYLGRDTSHVRNKANSYGAIKTLVKPLGIIVHVGYRAMWAGSNRYGHKGRYIWYMFDIGNERNSNIAMYNTHSREMQHAYVHGFGFIRWSLDWENLIKDAMIWSQDLTDKESRFSIMEMQASNGKSNPREGSLPRSIQREPTFTATNGNVPIHWELDHISSAPENASLQALSLSAQALYAVDEIKIWFKSRRWFHEHGIPWCRKYGLSGVPGTGKTSFARAIAHELGIPIYVVDLSSMDNHDLTTGWAQATTDAPCMILLEDIDSVFNGRDNKLLESGNSTLSFDCLLNCLDGVKQNNAGVLIMISTNHIDQLDEALQRAGRMDRVITFKNVSVDGKYKIAHQIIDDREVANRIALQSRLEMTPAEFQEICFREALQLLLNKEGPDDNRDTDSAHEG